MKDIFIEVMKIIFLTIITVSSIKETNLLKIRISITIKKSLLPIRKQKE